jgi:hypothetical protein
MSENEQKRESPMNIYVLQPGGSATDPNSVAVDREWSGGQKWTVISNAFDLVSHVKSQCGDKFYVGVLRIGGHGNTDRFRLGEVLVSLEQLRKSTGEIQSSVKIDELKGIFEGLKPYFIEGKSVVVLDTCYVGQNDLMLKKVSGVFGGIPVIAPFDGQVTNEGNGTPPLLEGKARVCNENVCFTMDEQYFF